MDDNGRSEGMKCDYVIEHSLIEKEKPLRWQRPKSDLRSSELCSEYSFIGGSELMKLVGY